MPEHDDTKTFSFLTDDGSPFYAWAPSASVGLRLEPLICGAPQCDARHVLARHATLIGDGKMTLAAGELELAYADGVLTAGDDEGRAALADAPWIGTWMKEHTRAFDLRFKRLSGRRDSPDGRADDPPAWRPGLTIAYVEVYPFDPTPTLTHESNVWSVLDAYCPDPTCGCERAHVRFVPGGGRGRDVAVSGRLGNQLGKSAPPLERALWNAMTRNRDLLHLLQERQAEVRALGPWIVASHYERTRLALPRSSSIANAERWGEIALPHAVVARLFEASSSCARKRPWALFDGVPFRCEMLGALAWEGRVVASGSPEPGLTLYGERSCADTKIEIMFSPRDRISPADNALRVALDAALVDGALVPCLWASVIDGEEIRDRQLKPTEMLVAVAALEAVAAGTRLIDRAIVEELPDLDLHHGTRFPDGFPVTGDVDVRLRLPELRPRDVDDDDDDLRDDDEVEPDHVHLPAERPRAGVEDPRGELRASLLDWAAHTGASPAAVDLLYEVADELDVRSEIGGSKHGWTDPAVVRALLRARGPMRSHWDGDRIDEVPRTLGLIVDFLEVVGHLSAELKSELMLVVRSEGPAFVERAKLELARRDERAPDIGAAAVIAKRRWRPEPGAPTPADRDPCPCGSGKRWKKCCKPR